MTHLILLELEQIHTRRVELGRAITDEDGAFNFAAINQTWDEWVALSARRSQIFDSQQAKDLGLSGGVDHDLR